MVRSYVGIHAAVLAVFVSGLAGCLSTGETDVALDAPVLDSLFAQALEFDHDHSAPEKHAVVHEAAHKLAFLDLSEEGEAFPRYGELDNVDDFVVVATLNVGGFISVDVAEPASPKIVGRYVAGPQSYGADVKVSDDGDYAFLAVSNYFIRVSTTPERLQENAANAQKAAGYLKDYPYGQLSAGIQVVDIRDKTAPKFVAFYPVHVVGVHMVAYHQINGKEYLFSAAVGTGATSAVPVVGPTHPGGIEYRVHIAEFQRDAAGGPRIVPVSDYKTSYGPYAVHDVSVFDDPLTGKPFALVSYWDYGVHVLDVSDPAHPILVAVWDDFDSKMAGNIHTLNMAMVGDRRIVTATEELFEQPESVAHVYVLDATNLEHVVLLSTITLPVETYVDGIRFSTHNHQLVGGRLYVAWYHAGVWTYDVSTDEKLLAPELVGFYLPNENVTSTPEGADVPDTWDVVVTNGVVWASDVNTGLIGLHFDGDVVGEATRTSTG